MSWIRLSVAGDGLDYVTLSVEAVISLKGTRCLGSVELVFEKRFVTVCCKMNMVGKVFKK